MPLKIGVYGGKVNALILVEIVMHEGWEITASVTEVPKHYKLEQVSAKRKHQSLRYLEHPTTGIRTALLAAVMQSPWGKRCRERSEGTEHEKIVFAMGVGAQFVRDAARNGELKIRGQIPGKAEYEDIPPDIWIQIGLGVRSEVESNSPNPFKVEPTTGVPPDPAREPVLKEVLKYACLEVNSRQFEAVFDALS